MTRRLTRGKPSIYWLEYTDCSRAYYRHQHSLGILRAQSTSVFILSVDAAMSRYQTSQLLRIRTTKGILSIYNLWLHAPAMAIQANAKSRRHVQPKPHKQHIVDFTLLVPHVAQGIHKSARDSQLSVRIPQTHTYSSP